MAVSLYEASLVAEANGQHGPAGVMQTFVRASPLMAALPVEDIMGAAYVWTREVSLGTNAFRNIGGSFTASEGQSEARSIPLKAIGGEIDVDTMILRTMGMGIRAQKEEAKIADLAQRIAYNIIKGTTTSIGGATGDPKGFDGLQARYGAGFTSVAVNTAGENSAQIIDNAVAALSMRNLDIAIQATQDPTHLLLPKKMILNITGYLRNSSSITQTKDEYGRMVTAYAGLPMIPVDPLGTVSGLAGSAFNESAAATSTSIYVVNMSDQGLHLVQNGGIIVSDLGEVQASPVYRTRVQWFCNVVDPHPRCVTRLHGITDLVAVA